ncbi:MAG TPA: hypothetical protein VK137_19715, partial [Planctomycetaceae bacterium]|nr:hypothetical protein [Planctomycetaceae bacterium]
VAANQVPLRASLGQMLSPLALQAVVTDGVLCVTTTAKAHERRTTRVYPVGDLADFQQPETYEELVQIIRMGTGTPYLWEDATISVSHAVRALVIRQSRQVHDGIVELLTSLRAARDVE